MISISRFIDSTLLLQVLEAAVLVMAAILLCLIVLLVLQKLVLEGRSRAVEQAAQRYLEALSSGAAARELPFNPHSAIERKALARALAARAGTVDPGELRAAPWYGELVARLQQEATRWRWGDRVAAFELLGNLGATQVRPFLEEAARSEQRPEAYAACLACLAKFAGDPSGLAALWRQLEQRHPLSGSFNEGLFRAAIGALNQGGSQNRAAEVFLPVLANADPHDPLTLNAISAVGKSGLTPLVPELAALYATARAPKEMRICCVRAIGMLQPDHPLLLQALGDPDWEVRAVGARYLRDSTPAAIAGLSDCLTSPAFYVRYNAACTLAALGARGRAVLESALHCADAFARDISHYALSVPQHGHP